MAKGRKEKEDEVQKNIFKLKLNLKSGIEGVDRFIQETKTHYLEFDIDDTGNKLMYLRESSERLIEYLMSITSVEDEGVPTLDGKLAEDIFNKLLLIVNNTSECLNLIKECESTLEDVKKDLEPVVGDSKKGNKVPNETMFEKMQKKVRG